MKSYKYRLSYVYEHLLKSPEILENTVTIPKGLRNEIKLYPFQIRSLGKMLQREKCPESYPNPLWKKKIEKDKVYYENVLTKEITYDSIPYLKEKIKGGILCEEMGTGKTAICIALILATKGKKGIPPLPFYIENLSKHQNGKILSLKELSANEIKKNFFHQYLNITDDLKEYLNSLPIPYFFYFKIQTSPRKPEIQRSKVYISHATLIIVPNTLIDQWVYEIHKFTNDGELKILICKQTTDLHISPQILSQEYDIVLIPHSIFQREKGRIRFKKNFSKLECEWYCNYEVNGICNICGSTLSPLMQIYWYRIIIDEGHVMGQETSKQTHLASNLLSECRWCCTGTPTPETSIENEMKYLCGLVKFLNQEPWCENRIWTTLIAKPIKENKEEALELLQPLLQRIMVRHKLKDIEIKIPNLNITEKYLTFSSIEKLRYNQVLGQIVTNLITSRWEGIHSLFHPSNRKLMIEAFIKLRDACFHREGLDFSERKLAMETIEEELEGKHNKSPLETEYIQILKDIYQYMKIDTSLYENKEEIISAKLEYILNKIQNGIPKNEKCILFTQSTDTMRRLLNTFDRLNIPILEFHSREKIEKRRSAVVTFETSDEKRIILMKTELAAFGINLVAANHILFIDPVLDPSMESQAIKRAHRIGQKKEVFVEKLIMKDSIEELMIKTSQNIETFPKKKEIGKIMFLLKNAKMIPFQNNLLSNLTQSSVINLKYEIDTIKEKEMPEDFFDIDNSSNKKRKITFSNKKFI